MPLHWQATSPGIWWNLEMWLPGVVALSKPVVLEMVASGCVDFMSLETMDIVAAPWGQSPGCPTRLWRWRGSRVGTEGLLWAGRDPLSQVETPEGLGPTQTHVSAKRGHRLAVVAPQHHPSGPHLKWFIRTSGEQGGHSGGHQSEGSQ